MSASLLPTMGKLQMSDSSSSSSKHGYEKEPAILDHEELHHIKTLKTVTLSNEQFEQLYLQPRDARRSYALAGTVGNPTPLGISAFLVVQLPLALDLLNIGGATAASTIAMLGAFYACAGIGLYLACIMEWVIGNTFPSIVFGSFGGFFISYAIVNQPSMGIAASFAPASDASNGITAATAGASSPVYNVGLGMFFMTFGFLTFIFFVCALRTNAMFVTMFFNITIALELLAAGYFHFASGETSAAYKEFKVAGAFALIVAIAGFYVDLSLLLASVGFPYPLPLYDLSTRVFAPKDLEGQE